MLALGVKFSPLKACTRQPRPFPYLPSTAVVTRPHRTECDTHHGAAKSKYLFSGPFKVCHPHTAVALKHQRPKSS